MVPRLLVTLALVLGSAVVLAGPAVAAVECLEVDAWWGTCNLEARAGAGRTQQPVSSPARAGGTGTATCSFLGEAIPCQANEGTWSAARSCYVRPVDPPPPYEHAVWEGNTAGAIYLCSPADALPGTATVAFWAAASPVGGPSPKELADRAVEAMNLRAGQIGIVPEPGPDRVGIIGLPTWLWIADPGESTTGPITRSASGGGITVTATARLDRVEWSMGDGTTVTCAGEGAHGTVYQASFGRVDSPTCGHTYTRTSAGRPGDAYAVSATSFWTVTWSGGGASGSIPLNFTRSTQIRVGEVQVIVTSRGS